MPAPLHLTLEFARAESAGQPHGFRFAAQTYLLRSPGGGFEAAEFPWSPELLADLRDLRATPPDPAIGHRIGAVLRAFLGPTGFAAHEQAIVDASRSGAAILVTIRSAAAELYALPWELLVLKGPGQMLGGIPRLVVRYEWPETTTCHDPVLPAHRRGRVLFAWSAAGGEVPAADHLAALRRHHPRFDPRRDVLPHASLTSLAEALDVATTRGPPVDVLHLLCHGAVSGATYGLVLDPAGSKTVVDAGRVQQLLAPHAGMLRAVVLAACDSGNAGEPGNHLGSVAQMIHRVGLRAVIASRFPLSAAGSSRFSAALYAALAARDATLERAFVAARDVLVREPDQLDWASVQLYARAADGDATRPFVAGPVIDRRTGLKFAVGLAAAGTLVLALALSQGASPPPAEPVSVAPGPAPAPIVTPPITQPVTTPPVTPPPVVVDAPPGGPGAVTIPPPRMACRAHAGKCPKDIVRHVGGPLGGQPPLAITVRCTGKIDYDVENEELDTPAARKARANHPDIDNIEVVAANKRELPCVMSIRE